VFCETPLALQLDEAQQMRDAARRAGRLLQVGLLMRSVAPYEHIKAAAISGKYGNLLSLATYRFGSYGALFSSLPAFVGQVVARTPDSAPSATIAALRNNLWRASVSETSNIRSSLVERLVDRLNLKALVSQESKRQVGWVGKVEQWH
jgi:hypothetical protein